MNVYIDLNKVSNTIVDVLITKMRFIDPTVEFSDKARKEMLELIQRYYINDSKELEERFESLLVRNFSRKVEPDIPEFLKIFRGEN